MILLAMLVTTSTTAYVNLARPFLGSLRPEDSPEKAVQLFGDSDLFTALAAYSDVHEITTIGAAPAEPAKSERALAMFGFEVRGINSVRVDDLDALEIRYGWPGERDDFVYRYIRAELSDAKLSRRPEILRHLEAKGPVLALVVESGYLLWRDDHSLIRGYLLANMVSMLSDTGGIPPSIAAAAGFSQKAFGHFQGTTAAGARAIYQREMKLLWSQPGVEVLPFRFGEVDVDGHHQLLVTERGDLPARAAAPAEFDEVLEGGRHWRLWTRHGAVHVWVPAGYAQKTAGVVYYLHGYYVNADGAWNEHRLAAQFQASGKNAVFIVPEASAGDYEGPFWDDPYELLSLVLHRTKLKAPPGPAIVLAHSGGFRTAARWTQAGARLRQIHLIDGFYGSQVPRFRQWLRIPGPQQLILTSTDTADRSALFAASTPGALSLESIPSDELTAEEKSARLLFMRSQYEHMELVTGEIVIPFLLKQTPLADY